MALDLGGIAQGYAAGMAVMALKRSGIQNAIVNVSGDIYCLGRQSPSRKWRVGIQHPRRPKELLLEVDLEDKVIITSGDYEKFFLLGGRRYSHILDPRTGYPVGDETVSATVIAKDPATADALATALCVLGARGIDIIDSLDDVEAVIAVREGGHYATKMSTGFRKRYGKGEKTFR
jgi:thiamine biosynthesis lipoprotein